MFFFKINNFNLKYYYKQSLQNSGGLCVKYMGFTGKFHVSSATN